MSAPNDKSISSPNPDNPEPLRLPTPQTTELGGRGQKISTAAANSSASYLPLPRNSLIGREHEVVAVQELLLREDVALLTLTGPGGIGKTRLALQIAANIRDHFMDGVYCVWLAAITDLALVLPTIAQTLGVQEASGRSIQEGLQEFLQHKHILLLLDNFEQILAAAPAIGEVLMQCRQLKIMVTSRATLHLYGEYEFPVPPLALPARKHPDGREAVPLEKLARFAAIELFVQRGMAAKPDFALTTANAAAIVAICQGLDGLPLALELAAAKLKLFAPAALLERLQQRLTLLTGGPLDLPPRQRTLYAEISWSYELLSAAQQALFRRLAIFAGGFTLPAARAISHLQDSSVLEDVSALLDQNLLRQEVGSDNEPRFWMLETIREYGLERLASSGEAEAIRRLHTLFFLALAEETEPQLLSAQRPQVLARVEVELDNLRAAVHWCLNPAQRSDENRIEIGLRLTGALAWFAHFGNHFNEICNWLKLALVNSAKETAAQAKALWGAGLATMTQGDNVAAIEYLKKSVALWASLGDASGLSIALRELSYATLAHDPAAALPSSAESVALARSAGSSWQLAMSVFILGHILSAVGDYQAAGERLAEAHLLFSEIGDAWGISVTLFALGLASGQQGDYARAQTQLTEAARKWPPHEDYWSKSQVLTYLGEVIQLQHKTKDAIPIYREALELSQSVNDKTQIALILRHLGTIAKSLGQAECSLQFFAAATLWDVAGTNSFLPLIDPAVYQEEIVALHAQMGEEGFRANWEKGRRMTLDQVLDCALIVLRSAEANPEQNIGVNALPPPFSELTMREIEVLRLLVQGLTYAQIADELIISRRTVNTHATSIYAKLDVTSRIEATRFVLDHHFE